MYKALITDLDGTVVKIASDETGIDQQTKDTVAKALRANAKIACATGRSWRSTKPIAQALGITAPCVIEGGTRIIDPTTEETLWEKQLSSGTPDKILTIFKTYTKSGLIHVLNTDNRDIDKVSSLPDTLPYVYLLAISEATALKISNQCDNGREVVAHMTPSWFGKGLFDVHVTHPQATKEHAIRKWQKLQGVTKVETIGMGDAGNDLPIFEAAGLKVAVGNATNDLKAIADYIAPNVEDNALQHVIQKFLLKA